MGPENFFNSGIWIIPVVMMILCFIFFRFFSSKRNFFGHNSTTEESPLDIIKKRYARGEISKTEFEQIQKNI
jgi:putative membrane protein